MTPTWHTGHKAASTPFLATQPIAPRRLRALLVTRARRGVPRACPLLPSLPRTRRFALISPRVRAHCPSLPRGRRPAPTDDRAPVPPRFLPPRAVRFNLRPPFLAKNVDLWQSARASRGRRGLHGTLLADRRRTSCLLAVSQPHKQCYGASPSHPASLLPAPEIDIFSQFGPSQEEFANRASATRLHNNKARPEPASPDRTN